MSCLWHTSLLLVSRHGYESAFNTRRIIRGKALTLCHIPKSYSSHPNDRASVSPSTLPSSVSTPPTSIPGSSPASVPNSIKNLSMGTVVHDSMNKQENAYIKISRENLRIVFGFGLGLLALGAVAGIVFYVHEQSNHWDCLIYKVIKNAMLKPVKIDPLDYPELCVPEHIAMLREAVFSDDVHLILLEGAQGSGKTALVQKLLNERVTKDNIPCYYWSLKKEGNETDFGPMFYGLFGIKEAVSHGILTKDSIWYDDLTKVFRRLKEEHGAPCVLVVDNAHRLFLNEQGKGLTLVLQECHRERLVTVIFIGSKGSILDEFRSLSGYTSRLKYLTLPPIPDQVIKEYLLGPLNDHLKTSGKYQLFDDQLAEWYISKFGSNFMDMDGFIWNVLKDGGTNRETYLIRDFDMYRDRFKMARGDPDTRTILDHLVKNGSFGIFNPYSIEAREYLLQNNIITKSAFDYTWDKRFVGVAYQAFIQEQKKP